MTSQPYDAYRPRSLKSLKLSLGEMDAALEWIEVGIRRLERLHKKGRKAALQRAADIEGVRVTEFDRQHIRRSWAQLQVVAVHSHVEAFLVGLLRERGQNKSGIEDGESLVNYVARTLKVALTGDAKVCAEILEYYRAIRNDAIHSGGRRTNPVRPDDLRARLGGTQYRHLVAPNPGAQLSFDDFILFTRAAKEFAEALVTAIAPDEELVFAMIDAAGASRIVSRMRRASRLDRRRQLLRNYLERECGLVRAGDSFVDSLSSRLIAQRQSSPSKTDRD
jgi:hypothetical protein